MEEQSDKKQEMPETKDYFQFGEVLTYFFRKKGDKHYTDQDITKSSKFNIRAMHWVNKISIVMFLLAIIVLVVRHLL